MKRLNGILSLKPSDSSARSGLLGPLALFVRVIHAYRRLRAAHVRQ